MSHDKLPLGDWPALPLDDAGPVFREPWEAQAFALVISLHEQGLFSWREWAACLSEAIARRQHDDSGSSYYHHWLAALEQISIDKNLSSADEIDARAERWRQSYLATPHGQPIELID